MIKTQTLNHISQHFFIFVFLFRRRVLCQSDQNTEYTIVALCAFLRDLYFYQIRVVL